MENMQIYEKVRQVPAEAKKNIGGGRLKGMTDINPMWRIKTLTEQFGPCGIGWFYEITDRWIETTMAKDEITANVMINLYIKDGEEWSKPIQGIGGSMLVASERTGLYVNDECVDGDCEVLTRRGWVKFKNYNGTDEIAQFAQDTDEISFVAPSSFIHKKSSHTYRKGDIIMTHGHRNLYETAKGVRKTDTAENLCGYDGKSYFDIKSGFYGEPKSLTPLQKVGVMIACDGTKHKEGNGKITWCLQFAKERKVNRLRELLKDADIAIEYEHTAKRNNPEWSDVTQFRFTLDDTNYKKYSEFIPLGNYPALMEELIFWDGAYSQYVADGTCNFFSTDKENIDYLQTIMTLSGQVTSVYKKERHEDRHNDIYTIYRSKNKRKRIVPITKYGVETDVYCVEVPTTYFLIRKNNEIYVTGNCYKMALTDAISVACKALGVGADVYWEKDNTKYNDSKKDNMEEPRKAAPKAAPKKAAEPSEGVDERALWKQLVIERAKEKGIKLNALAKDYKLNADTTPDRFKEVYEALGA